MRYAIGGLGMGIAVASRKDAKRSGGMKINLYFGRFIPCALDNICDDGRIRSKQDKSNPGSSLKNQPIARWPKERKAPMAIKDVFQAAVKSELAKSNGTKWGNDESVNVILALIADNVGSVDCSKDGGFVAAIKKVVNPSAFAQSLEALEMLKRESKKAKIKSSLMDFGS